MQLRKIMVSLLLATSLTMFADNTSQTVTEVAAPVTLSTDVDYHITSTTPFATTGSIDITNTDHAVVIFDNLVPSKAADFLGHITINGAKAVKNGNCQLRVYNGGAILLPFSDSTPLTIYTEAGFEGTTANDFSVNTIYSLAGKTYNNHIRSFKLKRGYMVCFATQTNGQGYSRVFIADQADREVSALPAVLKDKISFIRISKWNNVHKRGWAGYWNDAVQEKFNTSWCYNWDASTHQWDDREYVTQHHHEGWPGIADVGNNTGGANILGNNEPDNKADDKEQDIDVKNVLANWPQMMATGRRLGSPAVSGNYSWLYEFIDSIDARGWRCDFIGVHSYWYMDRGSWENQLRNISSRCGNRPIWITEMNYGANWTGWPGSDTSGSDANYAIQMQHMAPILDYLNNAPYIERYAYYNNVQDCRYAIAEDQLTPIGEYYANLPAKLAYNPAYEYIPKTPKTYAPSDFTVTFVPRTSVCKLQWLNPNGEFADSMYVERKDGAKGEWKRIAKVDVVESTTKQYSYTENVTESGSYYYRIHVIDFANRNLYSSEVTNVVNGTEGDADFQWGQMNINNNDDNYNFFRHAFEDKPAIVFGSPSRANANTYSVENVSSVTNTYCVSKFFPWNCDGDEQTFTKNEISSYLAVKPGNGKVGDLNYEAGLLTDAAGKTLYVKGDTVEYQFKQPFAEAPVVFVTPLTSFKNYPLIARVWDVTKDGFKIVLTRQYGMKAKYPSIVQQRVSYVAIDKGTTSAYGKVFTVKDTTLTYTIRTQAKKLTYAHELQDPMMYCQFQTFNRNIFSMLRTSAHMSSINNSCYFYANVDSSDPDNTVSSAKPLSETIGWMTIGTDVSTGIESVKADESANLAIEVSDNGVLVRDAQSAAVMVYSLNGAQVATAKLVNGEARLDINSLPSGVLVIKGTSGKATKIVINR